MTDRWDELAALPRPWPRVLVTGGLGFVGAGIVEGLLRLGFGVTVLDDASRGHAGRLAHLADRLRLVSGDVRDPATVRDAAAGCGAIVHLAAVQGTGNFYRMPERVLDVNVRGMLNVVEAAHAEGVERVFFSSSSEVYGVPAVFPTPETAPLMVPDVLNPRWSYGGSKIIGELLLVHAAPRAAFAYTVVRYHNVYGPDMGWDHVIPQFIVRLERGEPFTVQGDGGQTRAFCYIDDAVDASLRALLMKEGANEVFNIGNPGEEWTINDLIALLGRVSGRRIEPQYVPFSGEGTRRRVPDVTRATERLGFRARVTLEEGLRRTYAWYAAAVRDRDRHQGGTG